MFFGLHAVSVHALQEALSEGVKTEFSPLHEALFRRLRDDCRAAGASLLVLTIPTITDDPQGLPEVHKSLIRFLDAEGINAVDLGAPPYVLPENFVNGHPNPAGHLFIANALSAAIARRRLLD